MEWLSYGVMFVWYGAMIGALGAAGAARVLSHAESDDDVTAAWAHTSLRLAQLLMPLVVLATAARLFVQSVAAFGSEPPLLPSALIIIRDTPWGTGWCWQMGAALGAWLMVGTMRRVRWPLLLAATLAPGVTVGLTGHAAGADAFAMMLIAAHGWHAVAAGLWLGTLAIVFFVTRRATLAPDRHTIAALARTVERFSPQAMVSVSILASSGIIAGWQHINGVAGILSPYGFVLTAKVFAFGGAALCGLYNWRVTRPLLDALNPDGVRHLRQISALELALGLIALVLTSVLTGLPMPSHE